MVPSRLLGIVVLLTVTPLVAGCTEAPPPAEPAPDPGPSLSQFADCPWNYFDGTPVDCDALPPTIDIEPGVPPAWVCLGEDTREGWSLHWDPATDTYGIWYEIDNDTAGLNGVLRYKTNEEISLFTFPNATTNGFLRVPVEHGDNVTFRFLIYHMGYAWNGTGLEDATADEIWSLHDDQFWVVNRLTTSNATYTFQDMDSRNSTIRGAEGDRKVSFHEPQTYFMRGDGFHFSAVYDSVHFGRALQGVDTLGIERQCQLSRLAPAFD